MKNLEITVKPFKDKIGEGVKCSTKIKNKITHVNILVIAQNRQKISLQTI